MNKSREFAIFFVTDGASAIHNNGCNAISEARKHHIEWERGNGINSEYD